MSSSEQFDDPRSLRILFITKEGIIHGREAVDVHGTFVGPVREEKLDDFGISFICRPVETRASL